MGLCEPIVKVDVFYVLVYVMGSVKSSWIAYFINMVCMKDYLPLIASTELKMSLLGPCLMT